MAFYGTAAFTLFCGAALFRGIVIKGDVSGRLIATALVAVLAHAAAQYGRRRRRMFASCAALCLLDHAWVLLRMG
ncbi:hypothetical protein ACFQ2B_24435 [Streptomyces stramineus]